jgi:hypothetical protein
MGLADYLKSFARKESAYKKFYAQRCPQKARNELKAMGYKTNNIDAAELPDYFVEKHKSKNRTSYLWIFFISTILSVSIVFYNRWILNKQEYSIHNFYKYVDRGIINRENKEDSVSTKYFMSAWNLFSEQAKKNRRHDFDYFRNGYKVTISNTIRDTKRIKNYTDSAKYLVLIEVKELLISNPIVNIPNNPDSVHITNTIAKLKEYCHQDTIKKYTNAIKSDLQDSILKNQAIAKNPRMVEELIYKYRFKLEKTKKEDENKATTYDLKYITVFKSNGIFKLNRIFESDSIISIQGYSKCPNFIPSLYN